ncbi:excalibur calcium-binding domain-containing protein [Thalassotalea fonticola]|uniref:Excalibur calcium-binding domain-containing protein n=1 Tax=Thalassotalea fonticola TaxID=3065649 RepID=A0ABZ0GSN3_9GAMM|nr:excalibur calcium-binding domain-containing protein [Colwelliaceae bacterium S1-1]
MNRGQLTSWHEDKGFGFIKCDALNKDVFIHISTVKHMSRSPKISDFIYFEVEQQSDGKLRACHCRIEGVRAKETTLRVAKGGTRSSNRLTNLIAVLIICGIGFSVYEKFQASIPKPTEVVTEKTVYQPVKKPRKKFSAVSHNFSCDGRQHCSQMRSRAEAVYFVRHCPGVKMDGDRDGIPCENDSRF